MHKRILAGIVPFVVLIAAASARSEDHPSPSSAQTEQGVVRIGAVAYSPGVFTVYNDLRRYLNRNDFPSDYVLYSNYDSLVAALDRREIDIAWNTPLAHAQFHVRSGCTSQTLVMRDVDCGFRSKLIVRKDAGVASLSGLAGKTLILGSHDAAEATVLPLYYLKAEAVDLEIALYPISLGGEDYRAAGAASNARLDVSRTTTGHALRLRQSGEDLRGLLAIARTNVDAARQIAAAVQQQDKGIQQIFVAVTDQLSLMQATRDQIETTAAASTTVREQAARVSDLLGKYKI